MTEAKLPLKVFLCHAHADRDPVPQGDDMRGLYARLTKDIPKRTFTRTHGHKRTRPFQSVNP